MHIFAVFKRSAPISFALFPAVFPPPRVRSSATRLQFKGFLHLTPIFIRKIIIPFSRFTGKKTVCTFPQSHLPTFLFPFMFVDDVWTLKGCQMFAGASCFYFSLKPINVYTKSRSPFNVPFKHGGLFYYGKFSSE